jgi:hypothetical protein
MHTRGVVHSILFHPLELIIAKVAPYHGACVVLRMAVVVVYHLQENEASRHALWNGFPAARGGGDKEVYINNALSNNHKGTNEITSNFRCGPLACSLFLLFCQSEGRWFKSGA